MKENSREQKLARLRGVERQQLLEDLHSKYASKSRWHRLRSIQKRYTWLVIVRGSEWLKRLLDIVVSLSALLLFSPIMGVVALAIKLTDGGPVLYIGERVGQWGRPFRFPKFRSMVVDAVNLKAELLEQNQHTEGVTFKMKADPRITWIGRFIRRASIDELPQLWSVLIGDMSLVGPRPPTPDEVECYSLADRRRLDIRPGITCFWQVQGRSEISFEGQVELDVAYIESQSFFTDLRILLQTIPAVLLGKGAY